MGGSSSLFRRCYPPWNLSSDRTDATEARELMEEGMMAAREEFESENEPPNLTERTNV